MACAVAIGLAAASVQAQENATLMLRSGERLAGQLLDMGGVGFTMRVNGQERQIPTNDVAVIDFAGGDLTAADWAQLDSGSQILRLRSGQTISGHLYDISGSTPLKVTFKTASGEREFSSTEIGRIVLARPNASAVPTTGATQLPEGQGIAVPANQQWTPTGITVRRGETLSFSTTGEARLSTDPADIAGSAGARSQRRAPGSPLPQHLAGALIFRIGNSAPFPLGDQTSVTMPAAGELFLGINDDNVGDNEGGFRVNIRRQNRRR